MMAKNSSKNGCKIGVEWEKNEKNVIFIILFYKLRGNDNGKRDACNRVL